MRTVLLVACTCVLMACAPPQRHASPTRVIAFANLTAASGTLVCGRLTLSSMTLKHQSVVRITGEIGGLPPRSAHGFHVHEIGDCSAVDASSAGDHFNPTQSAHGSPVSQPHHGGDMNNLISDAEGVAQVDVVLRGVNFGSGDAFDVLNRSIVVHANRDDYTTQPAGNSGARVACGVITRVPSR